MAVTVKETCRTNAREVFGRIHLRYTELAYSIC